VRSPQPPLEYLITCSQSSLEGFELARLDQISQLRRKIDEIQNEWVEAEVAARFARLLLETRRTDGQKQADPLAVLPTLSGTQGPNVELPRIAACPTAEKFSSSLFGSCESEPSPQDTTYAKDPEALVSREEKTSLLLTSTSRDGSAASGRSTEGSSTTGPMLAAAFVSEKPARAGAHRRSRVLPSRCVRFVSNDSPLPARTAWQSGRKSVQQLSLFAVESGSYVASLSLELLKSSEQPISSKSVSGGTGEIHKSSSSCRARTRSTCKVRRSALRMSQTRRSGPRLTSDFLREGPRRDCAARWHSSFPGISAIQYQTAATCSREN
jgi:hypothetical protein